MGYTRAGQWIKRRLGRRWCRGFRRGRERNKKEERWDGLREGRSSLFEKRGTMPDNRHENYEILNLIGYGLAKFDMNFVREFGFSTKTAFYESMISKGVADTVGTVKNRQDLFDPLFGNKRKGWWQKGNTYLHRKTFIDSLFGNYNVEEYVNAVRLYIADKFGTTDETLPQISPIIKSKFKQLQITGQEAEIFFMQNYLELEAFKDGILEDARLLGDGFDFQIQIKTRFVLAEVKGIRVQHGAIRLTENEYLKAKEYKDDYGLIVVSNLAITPKMTAVFNPLANLVLRRQKAVHEQISYHSPSLTW